MNNQIKKRLQAIRDREIRQYQNDMTNDKQKETRHQNMICRKCMYSHPFAGMMFTTSFCKLCGEKLISGNTNTDVYCLRCARMLQKCKSCGKTID